MKHFYTTLIVVLTSFTAVAGSINATTSGLWETPGTWHLNRIPQNGDSIIIPANITVTLDQNIELDNVVIIIAGTLALNNGKIKLATNSRVIVHSTGKITAYNSDDQITIGTAFKFKGTQLLQTGYSYADATTGNAPNGFTAVAASTLPVTYQSFYASRQGNNIQLKWATSQEVNNQYYAVERSFDSRTWKQIAMVLGAGTTSLVNQYAYTDRNITEGVVYYRIRQTDISGEVHYSAIRTVRNEKQPAIANIYATSKQTITVDLNSEVKENINIQVVSMSGQVVARQYFNQASYRLRVNVPNAASGIYVVQVSDGQGWREIKKITL